MNYDTSGASIAVVGRSNIDLTIRIPHRPEIGRTAFGSAIETTPGGKALNQAVAVARLGGTVALISNAGADPWGEQLLRTLKDCGVSSEGFRLLPDVTTGAAIIEITPDGESYILLSLSPATELTTNDVTTALANLHSAVIVTQLDLPPAAFDGIQQSERPRLLIGNLIPHPDLNLETALPALDILVVNQHEADAILGTRTTAAATAAQQLRELGPESVVVTAGPQPAAYSGPDETGTVPIPTVDVVDTTGAGDAFLGALAFNLTQRKPLREAIPAAVAAGSRAVRHRGALLRP